MRSTQNTGRADAVQRLEQQQHTTRAKLDRGYDDFVGGRISEDLWTRNSARWEAELRATTHELSRLAQRDPTARVTGEKTLELVKTAYLRYQVQSAAEQRELLEMLLSNCTFDRGSLSPTYIKPFNWFAQGNETGDWLAVRDEFRNWIFSAA